MDKKTQHSLPIGTILNDKWVILEFIAKGGMGEIYRAHQLNLKRDVAIKTVSRQWLEDIQEDPEEKENALKRFRQEVLTMAQIRHPNVIQIYDFDKTTVKTDKEEYEINYIALEYVPGLTLRDTMKDEGFYPDEAATVAWIRKYFIPVLNGVSAIHGAGIFHRDIKPENVLLDNDTPKIADFGLARSCHMESMTCSLEIKGTPGYMAPEQFMDFKRADARTDIYALGKILYEAIAGKIPENAVPFTQVGLKDPEGDLFQKLDRIIRRATDKEPERRFQSVSEMKKALEEAVDSWQHSERSQTPSNTGLRGVYMSRKTLAILSVLAALLLVGLSLWSFHYVQEHFLSVQPARVRTLVLPSQYPAKIESIDGTILRLIPGGTFWLPDDFDSTSSGTVKVAPFYMDETPVTNQQFVDFLNQIRADLKVEDGAVKRDGKIYLYLGEALQGYEPIVFFNGRFKVKNSAHSSCPVIRVTGYGAQAYAFFYGKRLPTKLEWLYVAAEGNIKGGKNQQDKRQVVLPPSFFEPIKLPYPVMLFKPNFFGIRAMNIHLGAWVLDVLFAQKNQRELPLTILAGFETGLSEQSRIPLPVKRNPWEAFEEVGFRCVRNVIQNPSVGSKKASR